MTRGEKWGWQITNAVAVDDLCKTLKVPTDWVPVSQCCTGASQMQLADLLAFAGDRGKYFLGLMDFKDGPTFKPLFMDLLSTLDAFQCKAPTEAKLNDAHVLYVQVVCV